MGFNIHILTATGRMTPLRAPLTTAVGVAETAIRRVVSLHPIDLLVADRPRHTIPDLGVGGFCGEAHLINLAIDPAHPKLDFGPTGPVVRTIVHEVHHALRWAGTGYGRTLGAALVSEGLAGHFVKEVLGTPPEPWETAVTGAALQGLLEAAIAGWDDAAYDHAAWFFGSDDLPHWGGYAVGYHIIGRYLQAHPAATAAGLAAAEAVSFKPT